MDDDLDLSAIMVQPEAPQPTNELPKMEPLRSPDSKLPSDAEDAPPSKDLLIRVRLLFDSFPAKLKDIKPKKPLEKLSEEMLHDLDRRIAYILGAKTNVDALARSFPMALKTVEDLLASLTPLRIQGTHRVCADPEVQDLVKFCIIDSGLAGINSTPQQRLAFTLLTAALQCHVMNSAVESMSAEQKSALAAAMNKTQPSTGQSQPNSVGTKTENDDKYADL